MWIKCLGDLPYCFLQDQQSPLNCSYEGAANLSPQFLQHEGYHLVYAGVILPCEKTKFLTMPLQSADRNHNVVILRQDTKDLLVIKANPEITPN